MTITIDGETYAVPVISIDETCEFLDKFAERTMDGILHRELIGTYHNQQLVFGSPTNMTEYNLLWAKLTEATEYHTVTVPDTDGVDFTFTAYFSNVTRKLRKWTTGATYWRGMTVNFIAQSPKSTP